MKSKLTNALQKIIANLNYPEIPIIIQLSKDLKHGDFSCNIAMQLAGKLNTNPLEIAQSISNKLEIDFPDIVRKATVATPGFINIHIQKDQIVNQIKTIVKMNSKFGCSDVGKGKKALIEFVSANPTGPLTVGHG